jgi:hypothetical protein
MLKPDGLGPGGDPWLPPPHAAIGRSPATKVSKWRQWLI